jgi:arginine repressor
MAKVERGALTKAVKQYLMENPKAGINEVVNKLKEDQGITVSGSLVSRVKYQKPGKKGSKRGKRGGAGNQSDHVRAYLGQHPEAKPKEIQTELAKQGIKVSAGLISNVKHNFFKKSAAKKSAAPSVRVAARKTTSTGISFEQLLEAKRLVNAMGGIEMVRSALDSLEQLQ